MTDNTTGEAMAWDWEVRGEEVPTSPGSMVHSLAWRGTYTGDLLGEVLLDLAEHREFWGTLDEDEPVTITITPTPIRSRPPHLDLP